MANATFTHSGGYLIRLTVDASLATEDVLVLYMGIRLANSGLPVPALNETRFDNSLDDPPYRGWEDKMDAFLKWTDVQVGGGGLPFLSGVGNPIGVVTGIAGQFYLDTAGDALYVCTAGGNTAWRVV